LVGLEKSFGRSAFLRCKTSSVEKSLLFRCFRQQFYKTFVAAYFLLFPSRSSRGHIIPVTGPSMAHRPCLATLGESDPSYEANTAGYAHKKAAQTPTKGQVI